MINVVMSLTNKAGYKFREKDFVDICNFLIERTQNLIGEKINKKLLLNVVFINASENKLLNKQYRKKDIECEALTFNYQNMRNHLLESDLVINLEYIYKKFGQGKKGETQLPEIFVHGLLHALGYDHQTDNETFEMLNLQKMIIGK
jgi:rRNA maturation RNase YbeY